MKTKIVRMLGVAALSGTVGCTSLAAYSAGRVGCPPDEIDISNEESGFGSKTWTATCRGKTYYCSLTSSTGTAAMFGGGQPSYGLTSTNTAACTAAVSESTSAVSKSPPAEAADKPKAVSAPPPKGAGGFTFKSDVNTASETCTGGGNTWKELPNHRYLCSGTAADVGFSARVRLDFCDDKLCEIALLAHPKGDTSSKWIEHYVKLRGVFAQKYGDAYKLSNQRPDDCTGDALQGCFEEGRAYTKTSWSWPEGQSLTLTLGSTGDAQILIWIVYRDGTPKEKGKPNLDAL